MDISRRLCCNNGIATGYNLAVLFNKGGARTERLSKSEVIVKCFNDAGDNSANFDRPAAVTFDDRRLYFGQHITDNIQRTLIFAASIAHDGYKIPYLLIIVYGIDWS